MTVVDREAIVSFVRRYMPCECGGWSERFDGINIIRNIDYRTAKTSPTGVTLRGRENHVRSCAASGAGGQSGTWVCPAKGVHGPHDWRVTSEVSRRCVGVAAVSGAVDGAGDAAQHVEAVEALERLTDQAINTAGDLSGRRRASKDYRIVRAVLHSDSTPVAGHEQEVRAEEVDCTCGYGGFHEPLNPRCDRNITARASGSSAPVQGGAE